MGGNNLAGSRLFKLKFVDSKAFDLRVESPRRNSEFCRCAAWTGDVAPSFCQSGLDHFLFAPQQHSIQRSCRITKLWRILFEPGFIHGKGVILTEDHSPFNHILQLSNVSGPLVGFEQSNRFLVDGSELLSSLFSKASDEVINQHGKV